MTSLIQQTAEKPIPTSVATWLDGITGHANTAADVRASATALLLALHDNNQNDPFLSVILRTQGKRLEPLKDALLCLAAQSDDDFEVIVVMHDADEFDAERVEAIIDSQSEDFRARISSIKVEGGKRAVPLNAGVEKSRGQYISVFDDDDLVFGNWVEAFHQAAIETDGRMIRALAATQRVVPELWPTDEDGFRAGTWPNAEYARRFDQADHLRVNHSPFMTWAFPRWLFSRIGLRFDVELSVCEDWDLIQRGSLIAGVTESDHLTAIYRRWVGGQSSYTAHTGESWRLSEARVVERLNSAPILMPPGSVERTRQLLNEVDRLNAELAVLRGRRIWRILHRLHRFAPLYRLAASAYRPLQRLRARA